MSDELIQRAADVLSEMREHSERTGQSLPSSYAQASALASRGLLHSTTNPTRSEAREGVKNWYRTSLDEVLACLEKLYGSFAPEPRKVPAWKLPGIGQAAAAPWPRTSQRVYGGEHTDPPSPVGVWVLVWDAPGSVPRVLPADEEVTVNP